MIRINYTFEQECANRSIIFKSQKQIIEAILYNPSGLLGWEVIGEIRYFPITDANPLDAKGKAVK